MALKTNRTYASCRIKKRNATWATAQIVAPTKTAPITVLLANMGNGTEVFASCTAPTGWTPAGYNWYFATTNDSSLAVKRNGKPTVDTHFVCSGWTEDDVVYCWVKACDAGGNESSFSLVSRDANLSKVTGILTLDGPSGDVLVEGAILSAFVNDRLLAFETLAEATIP